ncbi:response regulator receiver domain-containing protein [Stella humosa]|uniref:Response regulator receiver domain-containing protein n=1 Tax=Stella humosa TaxID=94 RepID=A0A3N1MB27_9PROT|nr:response regulator [Stella humosa]ROP99906.1 response regulator receiver domain-containing protein [Stella humosa]BBK30864.1 response regulator [Stella humosa]
MARILVIDDDELVAKTIVALLESAAHEVEVAINGREALKAFRAGAFDLIVTDIFMPEVEGLETIREIRRIDRKVPIIAMSGGPRATIMSGAMGTMDHLEVAQLLGATRSVGKPITRSKLLPVVNECLSGAATGTTEE